ncbi:hypothetical protein MBANPS3_003918 [Mucor bainieri]
MSAISPSKNFWGEVTSTIDWCEVSNQSCFACVKIPTLVLLGKLHCEPVSG